MADTLLEQTRALHEDVERMERVIVKDLKREMKTHKEKLMQSHRVKRRLDTMQEAAAKLVKIYEDEDGARKEEIGALANKDNPFGAFYDRLKEVRDYYRRFPSTDVTEAESDEHLLKEEPPMEFTGEEGLGRHLDLHAHYAAYINARWGAKDTAYSEYVTGLVTHLAAVAKPAKATPGYREYLGALRDYLLSFYSRTQPLAPAGKTMAKVGEEVGASFDAGELPGWEDRGDGGAGGAGALDLAAFDGVEELEGLGGERLKEALAALGLKCGGTPRQRAERLWLTRSTPLHALDKKLFAAGCAPPLPDATAGEVAAAAGGVAGAKRVAAAREVAVAEGQVAKLCELLAPVIVDTKGRIEKRQAQTYEEMMAEQEEAVEEAAAGAEGDSEGEEEAVYNPLKLPLGWDGKPIPYWLYKLHGLNQEFKCEICGNYSYWGRRAYEKHFKEWRHTNGMRALGIPNNKNFFEVTRIDDALALWRDITAKQKGGFKAEAEEEYEDDAGNVYNARTYADLKKQGLI